MTKPLSLLALLVLLTYRLPCCHGFIPVSSSISAHAIRPTTATLSPPQASTTNTSNDKDPPTLSLSETAATDSFANYHLVWSRGVWKKMALTVMALWVAQRSGLNSSALLPLQAPNNSFLFNAILPTLSSACCWIQLLLNMVTALGCAGFNTYLGPLRPFFLGLLSHLTWITRSYTRPLTIFLRWTIALLPEMLQFWNTMASRPRQSPAAAAVASGGPEGASTATTRDVEIYLDCPTMGCVACIKNVNSSLNKALQSTPNVQQIQTVDSWLLGGDQKGGKAKLRFSTRTDEEVDPEILVGAMERAGFPCTVVDVVQTPDPARH